jgi:CubicO group peptidase (beta-lactamase class C family)
MNIRKLKLSLLLLSVLLLLVLPVLAQDEALIYEDPQGRYTTEIPASWTDASTDQYGLFTNEDGVTIYLLAVEAENDVAGIVAALEVIAPDFDAEPAQTTTAPAPNGTWTQNIYTFDDGSLAAALGQTRDGVTYVVFLQAPSQEVLQAANADFVGILLGISFAGEIDLSEAEAATLTDAQLDDLDTYIAGALEQFGIPGAQVAVLQNGQVIFASGYGLRDIASDAPVTPETLFMVGSVTKSMTTLMMATLVDEGVLDWDTPVIDILPDFALSDDSATPQIRVRDLVNHSSGVPRYDIPLFLESLTPEQLIASLATIPMVAQPGEQYNYSNQMFAAGGFVAAFVADQPYEQLIQERVFDPLGMSDSTLDFDAAIASDNHAVSYTASLEELELTPIPVDFERFVIPVAPAGAVWSNVNDMAQYMLMELAHGVAPDGTRIVSEENLLETWTPAVQLAGDISYAMGWVVDNYKGQPLIWHSGGTIGFSTDFAFLPEADLGVVVINNRFGGSNFNNAVREYVFELAYGLEHEAEARHMAAEESLRQMGDQLGIGTIAPATADEVADYVGSYERGVELAINDDDAAVLITAFGDVPLYTIPDEEGTFITGGGLLGFVVQFDENGLTVSSSGDPTQSLTLARAE